MQEEITRDLDVRPSSVALWFSALAGPVSFLAALQIKYAAVQFICANHHLWVLWVTAIAALTITVVAGFNAARYWPSDDARIRFMAIAGVALSVMFSVAIVALSIPLFFFSPCD